MMNKQVLLLLFCHFIFSTISTAQTYNLGNGTINACSGTIYDSGGAGGNYGNSQNLTQTICSGTAGQCVSLSFSSFNLEAGFDYLTIYDGSTTGSLSLGTYTGSGAGMPAMFTSSTGCLTLQFSSDISVTSPGFAASISCAACPGSNCPACTGPPPANDPCSGAQNLGNIPAPPACVGTTGGTGAWANFNTTNVCATAEQPYSSMLGCQPTGNMPSPSADVWYRFNITSPTLNVSINGLQGASIGLYSGTSCANMIPRGCANGTGVTLNATFGGLAAGTYYLQVSGANVNVQCPFTLSLQNNNDCEGCVIQSSLTVNPPPVNGTYLPGQSVNFCYTISNYNQTSINWLHGVVPTFGSGWNLGSLTTVNPANCSGQGAWNWYNTNVTSTATGATFGPGFYYESGLGSPSGFMDGNPGNNFGDNNQNNLCDWTFCWTISTPPPGACVPGASLNVSINSLGDGESGSWTSYACQNDPVTEFFATMACCDPPVVQITNPLCFGQNTGAATATGVSNSPWSYTWRNGAGTIIQTANNINGSHSISGLAPGNYSVTVVDNSGCPATVNFTITAPTQVTANVTPAPAACNGAATGSATVNANGGAGGYAYSWSPSGGSSSTASNLTAGTYTVTVTDANGCSVTASGTVTQPTAININVNTANATCGQSNGSLTINAAGGNGALQYSVNGGPNQASGTFNNLPAGNYSVVVTDANGCTATTNTAINNSAAPVIDIITPVDVLCNGGSNGSISISASGGTGVLNYSLNGGPSQASGTFNNLTVGNYSVVVTDANGCTVTTNVSIAEPAIVQASSSATNALCNGSADGTVTVNANGGTGALSYSLNGGAPQASGNFSGLVAGNYTVVVTDANGCTATTNIAVTEPTPVQASSSATNALCNGSADGTVTVNANGGTGALSYSLNGGAPQASGSFSGLVAGNYTVVVTDANGCTATTNIAVTEPTPLAGVTNTTMASCGNSDGTVTVVANGGTGSLQYSIDNGSTYQSSTTFAGLLAGNYSIIIVDANGCTASVNASVNNTAAPVIVSSPFTNLDCFGANNGTITINANNGTPPLNYSINNGSTYQTTGNYSNLSPGNYNIIVEDALGCQATASITISEPPQIILATVPVNTTCGQSNGTLTVNANGGTGAFTYSSNGGAQQSGNIFNNIAAGNYSITVTDANGCTAITNSVITDAPGPIITNVSAINVDCNGAGNGQITITTSGGTGALQYSIDNGNTFQPGNSFNNLTPGNFTIVVTDANGCTTVSAGSVTEPSPIVINTTSTPSSCGNSDGALTVNANGGTGALQYSINNGATYQSSNQFNGVLAGNYNVTVQDANGCSATVSATVNNAAAPVITATSFTDVSCFGGNNGSITINANGGTGALQFSIDNGTTFQSGNAFNNLTPGTYILIVEDVNGCQASSNLTISEPSEIIVATIPVNTTCGQSNGSVTVNANGGTGTLNYSNNGGAQQSSNVFNSLLAGNYTITVTDANGCTAASNISVADAPGPVISNVTVVNSNCNGADNGSINITTNGGTGAIQYSIDNGITFTATGTFNNLPPGNYNIVVTDINGCTAVTNTSVTEPAAITVNTSSTPSTCGNSDGTLTVNANGGSGALQYSIDNGLTFQSGNTFNGMLAGNYNVIVRDANGCTTALNAVVNNSAAPAISSTAFTDVTCFGSGDGSITVVANGGTGLLQYSIDNGATFQASNIFNNLTPGNYSVVVIDINGCDATSVITINEPAQLSAVINTINTTCSNSNGSIDIIAAGGTGGYQFSNNNGGTFQGSNAFSNLSAGNYNIVIQDANGCTANYPVNITNAPSPVVQNITASNISCNGLTDGSITVIPNGGSAPLQYSNNNGTSFQPGATFSNLGAGNYSIIVTDVNGCTATGSAIISEPAAINASYSSISASCGNADGSITVSASGGSGTLQYSIDNGVSFQSAAGFNFLPSGGYNIIIADANGCTTTIPANVNNAAAPAIASVTSTNITCNGNDNGTITINANGGTGALSYSIDNGITSQPGSSYNNLPPGIYNIVVTDVNGCDATSQVIITEPALLTASAVSVTATCSNSNGTITINANGGTAPLQYSNDNGTTFQAGSVFSNLTSGPYNLVITDANGCTASVNSSVANAPGPVMNQIATNNISCNGLNDGSLTIVVNGGTAPIQYSIDNGNTFTGNITYNSLGSGNYNIVVSDANGCSITSSASITEPAAINASYFTTNSSCGNADGSITVNASGGSGTLQYSIDNGASFQSANGFNFLPAGAYNIIVTDANGCTETVAAAVNNDAAPAIASISSTNITCNGDDNGSITINANGGTGALIYSIDNGVTGQASSTFSNLTPGIYNVVVTDINGCDATSQVVITEPALLSASAVSATATCGNNNGVITISGNGGTAPLQYSNDNGTTFQAGAVFSNLTSGIFNIVVTDANGCTVALNSNVANAPGPVVTAVFEDDITCFGADNGEITIAANGGTAPLQYSIDNGINFTSSILFGSLTPGNYNIVVMDANGCTATSSASLVQPTQITYSTVVIDANCGNSNGSIEVNAAGGSGGYTYSKDAGVTFQPSNIFASLVAGSYDIVVRDVMDCMEGAPELVQNVAAPVILSTPVNNVSCNGLNDGTLTVNVNGGTGALSYSIDGGFTWQPNGNFNNLPAGNYNISVTDATGCLITSSAVITEPTVISVNTASVNATCGNNDGSISVVANGGSGTLTYSLNGGAGQSNGNYNNLGAGNYNIVITDASGCTASSIASISNTNAPVIAAVNNTDVTCNGQNNGSISISANGGTGALSYSIDNGITTQQTGSFSNLSGGSYSILVTDANGCISTASVIINEPDLLVVNALGVNSTCGNSNGEIQTLVLGGTGAIQYSIDNGVTYQTSGVFPNLSAGSYNIIISDINGCTASTSESVNNTPGPIVSSVPVTDVLCNGQNDGSATVQFNGGTGPFDFNIGTGTSQSNNYFGGLAPGNYNVLVTDANGCTSASAFVITEPSQITSAVSIVNTTCGNSNGTVTINSNGGTGSYTYSGNGGLTWQSSATISNLSAGNYQVVTQDANGCTVTIPAQITDAPGPQVQAVSPSDNSCNNASDGSIDVTVNGGTLPLQFSIDNGITFQSSNIFSNLDAGSYNILITDANGCTTTVSQLITEPDAIVTSVASSSSTCSGGSNGAASVNVLGGTAPYNYSWSNGATGSATANNLQAGTYTVTVTDANGCTVSPLVVVSNISGPAVNTILTTDNLCFNSNDGEMTITPVGGTGPFTYSINNGSVTQSTGTFNNLAAGAYTVSITDANGCIVDSVFNISQPAEVTVAVSITGTTCSGSNGGITLTAGGGTGSYSYSINGGLTYQSSNIFISQIAGTYNVMIQDQNGCTVADIASILDAPGPVVQAVLPVNLTCNNSNDGQISINANGGTAPLQFSIDNGISFQSSNQFSNLNPGTYSIIISDANGCSVSATEFITEPDAILTSVSSVAALCDGGTNGSATVTAQGGIAPYNYSWSGGATGQATASNLAPGTYTVTVSDANGCTVISQTVVSNIGSPAVSTMSITNSTCNGSNDGTSVVQLTGGTGPFVFVINGGSSQMSGSFNNLSPGNYNVVITDANGCITDSAFTISEPLPVDVVTLVSTTTCSGSNGSITITATGGSGVYNYSIDGGFTFQQDTTFTNIPAGTYNITVQDAFGCTGTDVASLIDAPGPVVQSVVAVNSSCYGLSDGNITVAAVGGTNPLQYSIDNGTTYQAGAIFSGLASGTYSVIIQDANGCTSTGSTLVIEPAQLTTSTMVIDADCNGASSGSASASANGGTAPYTYLWSSGQTQPVAGNIMAGTYSVTITDANGCTVSGSAIVSEPSAIIVSETLTNTSCFGSIDGSISINVSGGNAPYTYFWSVPGNGNQINDLSAGSYSVTVTDNSGCTSSQSYNITEPSELTYTASATDVSCFGLNNGSAAIAVNGGTSPYTYMWSNNTSNATATGLAAGVYSVTITDANGCTLQTSETVSSPDELLVSTVSEAVTCNGSADGTASVSVSGGTQPYTYLWSNGSLTSTLSNINGGNYSVIITDANNCTVNTSIAVQEPAALVVTVSGSATLCIGQTATINAVAQGGNGGYTFTWNNGVSGSAQTVTPNSTTSYSVSVLDSLGCPASSSALTVAVNPPLSLIASPAVTICEGEQAQISAIASGGDGGPYTYHWSGLTQTTGTVTVTPATSSTYTVTVTDGCTTPAAAASVQVEVNLLPVVNFTPIPASGCAPLEVFFNNSSVTTTPGASYTWYFGDNNGSSLFEPSHIYYEPGSYTVTLKVVSVEGCTNSLEMIDAVNVYPVPEASFYTSPPVASILNPVIDFNNTSSGATVYEWDFGDNSSSFEFSPQHMYDATGIYDIILYVENDYGCRDTAIGRVVVEGASTVYIPNAFTPNSDGVNDYFNVQGIGLTDVQMSIYNRWGQIVFTSENTSKGWDGTDYYSGTKCPIGVYVYQVKVKSFKGDTKEYVGRVTLVE